MLLAPGRVVPAGAERRYVVTRTQDVYSEEEAAAIAERLRDFGYE
jgi:hypothetical protein